MNLNSKRIMSIGFCILFFSCNPNSADDSSTKTGQPLGSLGYERPPNEGIIPAVQKPVVPCTGQTSKSACPHQTALQKQSCLPQGKDYAGCTKALTLTNTSSSVYDYLNLPNEAYKNAYYASNVDIIEISKSIVKSKSQEEICRLSKESLKALDSVQKNFVDPYGHLKDFYDLFLKASQTTKAESCLAGQ